VNRFSAALVILAGVLASDPLGTPLATPTAYADHEFERRDRDDCHWIHTSHGRERVCSDRSFGRDRDRGWRDRDRSEWRRSGSRDRWRSIRHDDWGDCFRTPWGLACEVRPGVYRVRDRHRGDEPGPDCDVIRIEDWGWSCYDSPRR
jgi:hypothetical protein